MFEKKLVFELYCFIINIQLLLGLSLFQYS